MSLVNEVPFAEGLTCIQCMPPSTEWYNAPLKPPAQTSDPMMATARNIGCETNLAIDFFSLRGESCSATSSSATLFCNESDAVAGGPFTLTSCQVLPSSRDRCKLPSVLTVQRGAGT